MWNAKKTITQYALAYGSAFMLVVSSVVGFGRFAFAEETTDTTATTDTSGQTCADGQYLDTYFNQCVSENITIDELNALCPEGNRFDSYFWQCIPEDATQEQLNALCTDGKTFDATAWECVASDGSGGSSDGTDTTSTTTDETDSSGEQNDGTTNTDGGNTTDVPSDTSDKTCRESEYFDAYFNQCLSQNITAEELDAMCGEDTRFDSYFWQCIPSDATQEKLDSLCTDGKTFDATAWECVSRDSSTTGDGTDNGGTDSSTGGESGSSDDTCTEGQYFDAYFNQCLSTNITTEELNALCDEGTTFDSYFWQCIPEGATQEQLDALCGDTAPFDMSAWKCTGTDSTDQGGTDTTDTNSSSSNTSSSNTSSGGGGYSIGVIFSLIPPQTPPGGFAVRVNDGATLTSNRRVTLYFTAGSDVTHMAISRYADFHDAVQQPFQTPIVWDLCGSAGGFLSDETCSPGVYTLYVKFYSAAGIASVPVSTSVRLVNDTTVPIVPAVATNSNTTASANTVSATTVQSPPFTDTVAAAFVPGITPGDLIKSPASSAVYYYGEDGSRHVFPTEAIYHTWYRDFSGVRLISDSVMASIPLGSNMTVRPGSALIKLQTDPRVYAVDTNGGIHWVTTEQIARSAYGTQWARRVLDISDAYFPDYTRGTDITSTQLASQFPLF